MKWGLVAFLGLLVALGAGAAWFRVPQAAEAGPPRYLEVRLAQVEEVSPKLAAADPTGAVWARHFRENLPVKAVRACGVERFDAVASSDFFLAVQMPAPDSSRSLMQCMQAKGGGYLRFATLDRQER